MSSRSEIFNIIYLFLLITGLSILTGCAGEKKDNWKLINTGISDIIFYDVYFTDANNGWIVGQLIKGAEGAILHTGDGGKTWELQKNGIKAAEGSDIYLRSVYFLDANNGWIAGSGGTCGLILNTTDGGKTWNAEYLYDKSTSHINKVYFADKNNGWLAGEYGISYTTDGGKTWLSVRIDTTLTISLYGLHFIDKNNGWAVGFNGTIIHTSDGGISWTILTNGTSNNIKEELKSVYFVNKNKGWVVGEKGVILYTSDGGASWTRQNSWVDKAFLTDVRFIDENNGWISGFTHSTFEDKTVILHTSDGGKTWKVHNKVESTNERLQAIYFLNENNGWTVGEAGKVLKYTK